MAIPPLMEILVPQYGFRGAILILGGCMLHVCLSATFYRPMEVHQHIVEIGQRQKGTKPKDVVAGLDTDSIDSVPVDAPPPAGDSFTLQVPDRVLGSVREDDSSIGDGGSLNEQRLSAIPRRLRASSMIHSIEDLSTDSTCYYKDTKSMKGASVVSLRHPHQPASNNGTLRSASQDGVSAVVKPTCCSLANLNRYIDTSLTRNPLFLIMALTVMLMAVGCPHMLFYLPSYANSVGISRSDCSLLLSISALMDLIGRLGFGWIADLNLFSNSKAYCAR